MQQGTSATASEFYIGTIGRMRSLYNHRRLEQRSSHLRKTQVSATANMSVSHPIGFRIGNDLAPTALRYIHVIHAAHEVADEMPDTFHVCNHMRSKLGGQFMDGEMCLDVVSEGIEDVKPPAGMSCGPPGHGFPR